MDGLGPRGLDFSGIPNNERGCYGLLLRVTPMRGPKPPGPQTTHLPIIVEHFWRIRIHIRMDTWHEFLSTNETFEVKVVLISTRSEISWRARDAI